MYPQNTNALIPPYTATEVGPSGKNICNIMITNKKIKGFYWCLVLLVRREDSKRRTWIKLVTTRMMRLVKRMGPRKLKSLPLFAAQKVYAVKDPTTHNVNIKASSTILPDKTHR